MNAGIFSSNTRRPRRNSLTASILCFALLTLGASMATEVHAGSWTGDRIAPIAPGTDLLTYDRTSTSGDGNRIVFAARINPKGTNSDGNREVFMYDKAEKTFWQITHTQTAAGTINGFYEPVISADGKWIAFSSKQNLTGDNSDGSSEIFLASPPIVAGPFGVEGKVSQITHSFRNSVKPSINADGTRIAFASNADFVGFNNDLGSEVFVYDRSTVTPTIDQVTNLSTSSSYHAGATSGAPRINAAGDKLVYLSTLDVIAFPNEKLTADLIWHNLQSKQRRQITDYQGPLTGGLHAGHSIDGSGTLVAFSYSRDPVQQNPELNPEIFLYDSASDSVTQLTHSGSGNNGGDTKNPEISGSGRFVAFTSMQNLAVTQNNADFSNEVFLLTIGSNNQTTSICQVTDKQATPSTLPAAEFPSINTDGTVLAYFYKKASATTYEPYCASRGELVTIFPQYKEDWVLLEWPENPVLPPGPKRLLGEAFSVTIFHADGTELSSDEFYEIRRAIDFTELEEAGIADIGSVALYKFEAAGWRLVGDTAWSAAGDLRTMVNETGVLAYLGDSIDDSIGDPDEVMFRRGDGNDDGNVDLSDAVFILNYLFGDGGAPACMKSADMNDSGDVDISSPIFLLNYLFSDGPAPPGPFNECGVDPTSDGVTCKVSSACK